MPDQDAARDLICHLEQAHSKTQQASGDLFCEGAIDPRSTHPSEIPERAQLTPACLVRMRGLQRADKVKERYIVPLLYLAEDIALRVLGRYARGTAYARS